VALLRMLSNLRCSYQTLIPGNAGLPFR